MSGSEFDLLDLTLVLRELGIAACRRSSSGRSA